MPHLTILIDGNSIGHAAHHVTRLVAGDMQTQAVYGFIRSLRELRVRHPLATIYVLWDGKAQFRYDLCPEYKSNRNNDPKKKAVKEAYKAQMPFIKRAVRALGVVQMLSYIHEADDLAGLLVSKIMKKPDQEILMISGDQDWAQLVREGVTWRDPRENDRVINLANFAEKTGYRTPLSFLEGKALHGDSSDCIPGVGGIGEGTAPLLLAEHGSVRAFIKGCDEGTIKPANKAQRSLWKGNSPFTRDQWKEQFYWNNDDSLSEEENDKECKKALKKHMDEYVGQGRILFVRNMKIMQLLKPQPLVAEKLELDRGAFSVNDFSELCGELNFMTILRSLDNFINPFKPN